MPKTPSSRLFDLIKSLSGSEKRYFKVANKGDSNSKYWVLFNAIENQDAFDEAALLKEVYGEEKIESRKYSELKAYLYSHILKCLQQYDEQASIDYQLKSLILSVRSLYRRWLFADCKYLLKRTKKLALKYERFATVLEVLDWEKQLAYAAVDIDFLDDHLASLLAEEEECLSKMANIKTYEGLFYQLYLMVQKNMVGSVEGRKRIDILVKHPLLADENACQSFRAKVLFYRILSMISYQFRDYDAFFDRCKTLIELMESRKVLLKEDAAPYISALSNFATSCGYKGALDELRETLQKLKKIKAKTLDDELKIHRQYYTIYFSLCINTGNFEEGYTVLQQHLKDVKKLANNLFERSTFFFQYFYIYFGVGDYDQALNYLNEWLNLPRSVEQQDLQHLARLLNLLVHFEIGNSILLTSLLRSTQRNLQKKKRYNAFEQLFLQCLRQANQQLSYREQQKIFQRSLQKFEALDLSAADQAVLRFFDFKSWWVAKAEKRPFAVVVQEKNA